MTSYSERGYEIFTPMGNSRADFIAVKESDVIRVQVKTAQLRNYKKTQYTLGVLTTTRNGISTPYTPAEIDTFFVLGYKQAWEIPNKEVYPSKTVMLSSTSVDYKPRHGLDVASWEVFPSE
jgi:hypothetical protein